MNKDQHSRSRKHLLLVGKIVFIIALAFGGTFAFNKISSQFLPQVQAGGQVDIWWPTNNAKISGLQPFKARVADKDISEYDMFWSVDGGQQNSMNDSQVDAPHKEASVDLTNWNWHGSGPYKVTFKALEKNGNILAESSIDIYGPDAAVGPKTIIAGTSTPAIDPNVPSTSAVIIGAIGQAVGVPSASAQSAIDPNPANLLVPPKQNQAPSTSSSQATAPTPAKPAFLSVHFPATNSTINGVNAFRAAVDGMNVSDYTMYWQVDDGQKNNMYESDTFGSLHKEASVDVSGWSWRNNGPYKITFTAEKNGTKIASSEVSIMIGTPSGNNQTQSVSSTQKTTETQVPVASKTETTKQNVQPVVQEVTQAVAGNPLSGLKFFVNPNSNAKRTADEWRNSRQSDAFQMDKIASSPEAIWLGGWNGNVQQDVANKISAAKAQGSAPVFIAYNIPMRDCGSYSAGGVSNGDAYRSWIRQIASGIGGNRAIVVLEPDGLTSTDCLSQQQRNDRFSMISDAVSILKNAGALVYIDAGHSSWVGADEMASRLTQAGIAKADGFALNVSNFQTTQSNIDFGTKVSAKVGGKHFVIDTARNGAGPAPGNEWCNPSGRALGLRSTANTGNTLVDAYLWLTNPGESDGNCNGGPSAGVWWPEYALELAKRSAI
jgi:endoglucanase